MLSPLIFLFMKEGERKHYMIQTVTILAIVTGPMLTQHGPKWLVSGNQIKLNRRT